MAADTIAAQGWQVVIAEAMPSAARKFLMAGKSGLNLTKDQPLPGFVAQMRRGDGGTLEAELFQGDRGGFGPAEVMAWAEGLGVPLFVGTTGRVFPTVMKASTLLRAWLRHLSAMGVELRTGWRWTGMAEGLRFETPDGVKFLRPAATVLALGGASWPRLGANAEWVSVLADQGVTIAPLRPANMGFRVAWSAQMARHFGAAVKGVAIRCGQQTGRGEWIVSRDGIEGGGIYEMSALMRDGSDATVDLFPDLDMGGVRKRFARPRGKLSIGNWLRRVIGDPVKVALLLEWCGPLPNDAEAWAQRAKSLPIRHDGPAAIEGAISSAGGISFDAMTSNLELRDLPGIFAAGEMLDWEAPTGGYLLTGCLATGRRAGQGALSHLEKTIGPAPI